MPPGYVLEWLNLLVRWLHVTAGVAWIGTSFYFIALDYHMRPSSDDDRAEAWEIHGGGFYRIEKYYIAPQSLPAPLHWFKWEAYTTWLSGFLLLIVLYYANPTAYLIDRQVADLSPVVAVAISVGLLLAGWFVYDGLSRLLEGRDLALAAAIAFVIAAMTFGVSHLFGGRGTYIQVGAIIGTWMVANVFRVIIPGQREVVAAKAAGREPDPMPLRRGKQRSVHNNYLTLPVLFTMISTHFPLTYGHPHGWLVLLVLMALSAWLRHFFNQRNRGRTIWAIPGSAAVGLIALAVAIAPRPSASPAQTTVSFQQVQGVMALRCVACHSAHPSNPAFATAPKGVVFDTPDEIRTRATEIYQQAVVSKAMPLGNLTEMTQAERDLLAAWFEQGASAQ
jgi:uncharacterized membrane protein